MPTEKKIQAVGRLAELLARSPVVIATHYRGLTVGQMVGLRGRLRPLGVEYHVVKNSLARLAGEEAGRPELASLLSGPTAIAFGAGDPVALAKALQDYVRTSRTPLTLGGALLDGKRLTAGEVATLATLPPREVLLSQLLGGLQGPLYGLVYVLNASLRNLMGVLQARMRQLEGAGAES